jgi:hypothetical protein
MIDEQWRCDEFDVGAMYGLLKQGKNQNKLMVIFQVIFGFNFIFHFQTYKTAIIIINYYELPCNLKLNFCYISLTGHFVRFIPLTYRIIIIITSFILKFFKDISSSFSSEHL